MARYVLLEFDDNKDADDFVHSLETDMLLYARKVTEIDDSVEYKVGIANQAVVRVRAVWAKPTQFCECPPSEKSARGKKWGWWIHSGCGRPKRGHTQHPRNLLEPEGLPIMKRARLYLGVTEPQERG